LRLKSFFSKGILLCVLGMLLLATNNMFLKQLQQTLDFWSAFFWTQLLNVIFLIPAYPLFKKDLKKINVRQVKNLFLLSCIALISDAFFLMAYKANVSVTSLIAAIPVSMLMAIGLAFFKPSLLEKHPPKIYALRLFCAAVMIYSALQLSK